MKHLSPPYRRFRTLRQISTVGIVLMAACSTHLSLAGDKAPAKSSVNPGSSDPLKALAKERDEMRGVTWYRHSTSPRYVNSEGFYLYFGKNDKAGLSDLRLVVRYYGDDWLFVQKAWAKADGREISIPQEANRLGWERDNKGGKVWEWSDTFLDQPGEKAEIRRLAAAKSVTVRFEGKQYYKDRALSGQQLKAMREVIEAYEKASGKPWR